MSTGDWLHTRAAELMLYHHLPGVTVEDVEDLLAQGARTEVPAETVIGGEGEASNALFIILEGRIQELEGKIGQAEVIDPLKLKGTRVIFGATVELEDVNSGDVARYMIVGDDEADVKKGMISISSPVARALINKNEGDEVRVKVPGGLRTYEIVEVTFGYPE